MVVPMLVLVTPAAHASPPDLPGAGATTALVAGGPPPDPAGGPAVWPAPSKATAGTESLDAGGGAAPGGEDRVAHLVRFAEGRDPETEATRLTAAGVEVRGLYHDIFPGAAVDVTEPQLAALRDDPAVADITVDRPTSVTEEAGLSPAAVQTSAPWGLDRSDQRNRPLSGSYTYPNTGAGVTAYVVDGGVRADHVAFGGRVRSGFTTVLDGQGTNDCFGHGTHVAGILGSSSYGMAKGVSLVAVRVLDCEGYGDYSGLLAAADWIIRDHQPNVPAVANLSLGGPADSFVDLAVDAMVEDGVTVVVAAGNESQPACGYSPARASEAITVGSTNSVDTRASTSNYGTCVDLFAPGDNITSTYNSSSVATRSISGTSMASPHVAGAAAVLLAQRPLFTPSQVAAKLIADTTLGVVGSPGAGSPNRLLYSLPTALAAPAPPTNDTFPGNIVDGTLPMGIGGTNVSATVQSGEPQHAGLAPSRSVWWRYTPTVDGTVIFRTQGSAFDTVLGVYSGGAVNALTTLASNDDAPGATWSEVTMAVTQGVTYHVAVGGKGGASGPVTLSVGVPPPVNDHFAAATEIVADEDVWASNVAATFESGEPYHAGQPGEASVWWTIEAPANGMMHLSTGGSDFDTVLAVYSGPAVDDLVPLAANDDATPGSLYSALSVQMVEGFRYAVVVNGWIGYTGQVRLKTTWQPDPAAPATRYVPLDPVRILDSRAPSQIGPFSTPWGPGKSRDVTVAGASGVPIDATAVALNVTVTGTTGSSFLSLWPSGQARPVASSLNWKPGWTIANAVTVKVGSGGKIWIYNNFGNADVVIDVVGYYDTDEGAGFTPLAPVRIQDSRAASQVGPHATAWKGGVTRRIPVAGVGGVPTEATAVVLNATVTGTTGSSYLTIWPAGTSRPLVSSLNWQPGWTLPNAVTVRLSGDGKIDVYNNVGDAHVVLDVVGYFTDDGGTDFHPLAPARVQDSRAASQVGAYESAWGGGTTRPVTIAGLAEVPDGAAAVLTNTTVTSTSSSSYLTLWPNGLTRPVASSLNWQAGWTVPNAVTVMVGDGGAAGVYNNVGSVHVITDVAGWYG
jgi:subtilisin family serine protease